MRRPTAAISAGSTTITASNSRPFASGAGTTTIGRSGSTSPGSASTTPRASSAARSAATRVRHRDHRDRRELGDQRDRVLGDLVDELAGARRGGGRADRRRGAPIATARCPARRARSRRFASDEDRARKPVAHRELGRSARWRAGRGARASPPSSPGDAGPVACARSPSTVIECRRARRASIRSCIGERSCASSTTTCSNWRGAALHERLGLVEERQVVARSTRRLSARGRSSSSCSSASSTPSAARASSARCVSSERTSATAPTERQHPSIALRDAGVGEQLGAEVLLVEAERRRRACTRRTRGARARAGTARAGR